MSKNNISSIDPFHRLAITAISANTLYIIWLPFVLHGIVGVAFYVLEILVYFITLLFTFNHWTRHYQLIGGTYSFRTPVDVYIPTVDEPISMLRETIAAASKIEHPAMTVYVLDDGSRTEVKALAKKYGCRYLVRPDRVQKMYKAANLNYAMRHSGGTYILTIDADNVIKPTVLDDLLGYFSDKKVAVVASRQAFTVAKGDFNHDHLFYNHMQSGKNSDSAAISCGSGAIYRRSALEAIGGFSEWNLVEDLYSTYILNSAGYRSIYVSQEYTLGHAPTDLSQVYKQRGTWALDTMRMFFWHQPLLNKKLAWRQRLHYFEFGYSYLGSAFFLTGIYYLNFYCLLSDDRIINAGWWYVVMRLPALIATMLLFGTMSQGQLTARIWAGLFPVYQKATFQALLYRRSKPRYVVTSKVDHGHRESRLIMPQLATITFGVGCLAYHYFHYGSDWVFIFNTFWISVMLYWLWPIVNKGLQIKGGNLWQRKFLLSKMNQVFQRS